MMQAVLFIGAQACGKSTYYKQRFSDSHIRLNLDMLKTRNRETVLLEACIQAKQSFVVDNTNPCRADRKKYIDAAKRAGFEIIGYYFSSAVKEALERNKGRAGSVPDTAILCTCKKLELPGFEEGFDRLYYVRIVGDHFETEEWNCEI